MFEDFTVYNKEWFDNTDYFDMIKLLEVFPTQLKARASGFEAHHIIPVIVQYYRSDKTQNRTSFRNKVPDDTCCRATIYDHVLLHCKGALEFKEKGWVEALKGLEGLEDILSLEYKEMLDKIASFSDQRASVEHHLIFYNNGAEEIRLPANTEPPEGFQKGTLRNGSNHNMYGKHHKPESKEKMSKARLGRSLSLETRMKMSKTRKGCKREPLSDSTKQKISQNTTDWWKTHKEERLGENHPLYGKTWRICNNGIHNKHVPIGDPTPVGFVEGSLYSGDLNKCKGKSKSEDCKKKISEKRKGFNTHFADHWSLTSPDNVVYSNVCLKSFCREHFSDLRKSYKYLRLKGTYEGWTCRKLSEKDELNNMEDK